ncbi:hypothetical protein SY88_04665 [Clostridiales bacterium PH28_bin88]|nr:hypothetical protein SY88_04665 [Clostridiales bacterium PH28_bin88]
MLSAVNIFSEKAFADVQTGEKVIMQIKSGCMASYFLMQAGISFLVTISGLFRDTFAYMVELLDGALAQVARLEEQPEDNRVKRAFCVVPVLVFF